jgi:hypothetical protein
MTRHRNPRPRLPKRPTPDNPDAETGVLIRLLYEDLVEVEALAVTADEAVTNLPPRPRGKYGKTLARLYTLVGKTSGRAQGALERGEELVALRAAQLVARVPKRARQSR